jgi:hypothetical protein
VNTRRGDDIRSQTSRDDDEEEEEEDEEQAKRNITHRPAQISFCLISGGTELSCSSVSGVLCSTSGAAGVTTRSMADLFFLARVTTDAARRSGALLLR